MALTQKPMLILLALLVGLISPSLANYYTSPTYTPPATSPTYTKNYTTPIIEAVVEGVVYCQTCKYAGTWSLTDAKLIPQAEISITCRNYRQRVSFYKAYKTNNAGYFYAKLDGFHMKHPMLDHPLQACTVKLVSSPLEGCNEYSNINYGEDGANLRFEDKIMKRKNYEAVIYSAGPLAFREEGCAPEEGY